MHCLESQMNLDLAAEGKVAWTAASLFPVPFFPPGQPWRPWQAVSLSFSHRQGGHGGWVTWRGAFISPGEQGKVLTGLATTSAQVFMSCECEDYKAPILCFFLI